MTDFYEEFYRPNEMKASCKSYFVQILIVNFYMCMLYTGSGAVYIVQCY